MTIRRGKARQLGPADWAKAAFKAIARGGVDAVAVEPLAVRLGTTKGSFYWHFRNRDALIEAALDEWEKRLTDDVIDSLERLPEPAIRLKKLLVSAFELWSTERSAEVALLSNPGHPLVRTRVRKVMKRRVQYIADQFEALGREPAEALDRAVLLSHLYVGCVISAHVIPDLVSKEAQRRHAELTFESLVVPGGFGPATAASVESRST